MKAKDLTQADVGKWVTVLAEVTQFDDGETSYPIEVTISDTGSLWLDRDAILEFTDPPPPVQEVGDVFRFVTNDAEWTISMINGDACLLRYLTGHISADYPLDPDLWEFVRKGTAA